MASASFETNVIKNCVKFTEKHLGWGSIWLDVSMWILESFLNICYAKHLPTVASVSNPVFFATLTFNVLFSRMLTRIVLIL